MSQIPKFDFSKKLMVINSASSVATRILSVTVLVWMFNYLLSRIPPEEFAIYPVVMALMVFAPLFFSFLTGGVSRYVVDAYAREDLTEVRCIISSLTPLLGAVSAAFLLLGLAFSVNIEKFLNISPNMIDHARIMMALLIASFTFQMISFPFITGYHIKQRFVEFNILQLLKELLRLLLVVTLLLTVGPQVIWVVASTVVAEFAFQVAAVVRSRQMVPDLTFDRRLVNWSKARELLSFGLWTTVGRLGATLFTNAATLILNIHGTAIDVTSYFVGATFYRQLETMILTATYPLQPSLTAMNALRDRARLASTVFRGGRYALWASMIVTTPLIVYADNFVALYLGEEFGSATIVIILFMVIFPFTQPTALLPMTAMAMARVREFFLPAFLFQLLGFGLMYVFAAKLEMGALGVTLALTIITVGSQLTYFWRLALTLTGETFTRFVRLVIVPGFMPAVAGLVVWLGLKIATPPDSWIELFGFGALGAVAYAGALLIFCLDASEQRDLRAILAMLRPTPK